MKSRRLYCLFTSHINAPSPYLLHLISSQHGFLWGSRRIGTGCFHSGKFHSTKNFIALPGLEQFKMDRSVTARFWHVSSAYPVQRSYAWFTIRAQTQIPTLWRDIYIGTSNPALCRCECIHLGINSYESLSGSHYILETSRLILVSSFPIGEAVMWVLGVDSSYFLPVSCLI